MSNKRPRSDDDPPKHLVSSIEVIALRDKDGVSWNVPMPGAQNNEGANDDSYDITMCAAAARTMVAVTDFGCCSVRVHTDTGLSGIGQCEAPSLVSQFCSSRWRSCSSSDCPHLVIFIALLSLPIFYRFALTAFISLPCSDCLALTAFI